ncbi:MFS transporter [Rhodococcus sp. NPDC127528]|uniref:MFS transporter n=1 Tax=unclassified Rhodococcus (in: high G+C Gram-positive bacteria) TaxID=192944 RepID=UPI003639A88B
MSSVDVSTEPQGSVTPPSRSARYAWVVVALIFMFMFFNFADKAVVGLAGVEMIHDLGIDKADFGLVQSSFFWLYAVGAILGGLLVTRIPARWLLAATGTIWVLALLPMVWSTSFTVLVVTRVILGLAEGPSGAMAMNVIHSWFPESRRALPSSIIIAGTSIGPVVAAPVITAVVIRYSWHAAFAVTAAAGMVWVVLWLIFGRAGNEPAEASTPSETVVERLPYRRLLLSGTVFGACVLFFATYTNAAIKVTWLPLYLREGLGYDATTAGNLVTLPYLASAFMMISAGLASRLMTKRGVSNRIARSGFAAALVGLGGISTIAFTMVDRGVLQILLISVGASFVGGANGVAWAAVSELVPAAQRGVVYGYITAIYSLGGIIGPLVLGHLVGDAKAAPLDGYSRGFVMLGTLLIVCAVLAFFLLNPDRDLRRFRARSADPAPVDSGSGDGLVGEVARDREPTA